MIELNEGVRTGSFILSIDDYGNRSRDNIVVKSGSGKLSAGTVLAAVIGGGSVTTTRTGTGNGVVTPDATTPILPGAVDGAYTATCITAAANGGTFRVTDPAGRVLGDTAVGATFSDQIKFVIADGATDFAVGDTIRFNVASVTKVFVPYDETGADGSQVASALLYQTVDATSSAVAVAAVVREAEVIKSMLGWKVGVTSAGQAQAYEQLSRANIQVR